MENGDVYQLAFLQEMYDRVRSDFGDVIESRTTHRPQKIDLDWGWDVVNYILDHRDTL